ncbi:MAG: LytTR family DNA-binding domain-containing protein [Defluviitaleaceae bacterium]|nr:LytTR family DNA-binding domain-containing protein [Defluviitaleaceae bacterium]
MALFVAICDDEKRIGAELERALISIFSKQNIYNEIDVYYTGEELCAKMEEGAHYDLIFLDIEFAKNAINGVEVGKLIRETYRNDLVSIVFISWEMKYSMQLFDIRPLHFLVKPFNYAKIEQAVMTHLRIAGLWSGEFSYKVGHNSHKVQIKDIVYLQSDKRKLILHLSNGRNEEFYGTLKEVYQEQLKRFDFIFIHASCVVNYDYIAIAKYDEMVLIDGITSLQISQPKRKAVKEAYYDITERRG